MGHWGGRGAAVGIDGVVTMGSGAVQVVWAALGVEHPEGRVVVWRRRMSKVRVARCLLNGGHHGAWRCCMGGAVGQALAV